MPRHGQSLVIKCTVANLMSCPNSLLYRMSRGRRLLLACSEEVTLPPVSLHFGIVSLGPINGDVLG